MELNFAVQGSADEPYLVTFRRDGDNLTATCSCRAGELGQLCKHRVQLINGDVSDLVSDNEPEVDEIAGLIAGTGVSAALDALRAAEQAEKDAKREVANRKKALARVMAD